MSYYPLECPSCKADLKGNKIDEKYISAGLYGLGDYYSRVIGIYDWEKDETVAWQCPECNYNWSRFDKVEEITEAITD